MVIAPANTGKANSNKKTVISTDQTNSGSLSIVTPGALILNTQETTNKNMGSNTGMAENNRNKVRIMIEGVSHQY